MHLILTTGSSWCQLLQMITSRAYPTLACKHKFRYKSRVFHAFQSMFHLNQTNKHVDISVCGGSHMAQENTLVTLQMIHEYPLISTLLVADLLSLCVFSWAGMCISPRLEGTTLAVLELSRILLVWSAGKHLLSQFFVIV